MLRKTQYIMEDSDREAVIKWLEGEMGLSELAKHFDMPFYSIRNTLCMLLRDMYVLGYLKR